MHCIICDNNDVKSSIEHIIPEALGNKKFCTDRVCIDCNNKLGTNVDSYISEMLITKIIRKDLNITGKSGNQVKVFPSYLYSSTREKYLFRNDIPFIPPIVELSEGDTLHIEANNKDEAVNLAKTKLEKLGVEQKEIEHLISNAKFSYAIQEQPEFRLSEDIHLNRLFIFALKIAYEFCHLIIGDKYLDDEIASNTRVIMRKMIKANKTNILSIANNCDVSNISLLQEGGKHLLSLVTAALYKKTPFAQIRHVLFMHGSAENQLICEVHLFMENATSFSVLLSKQYSKYFEDLSYSIIAVFDDGSFRLYSF